MITGISKEIEKMEFEIEMFKEMENKYIENKAVLAKLQSDTHKMGRKNNNKMEREK